MSANNESAVKLCYRVSTASYSSGGGSGTRFWISTEDQTLCHCLSTVQLIWPRDRWWGPAAAACGAVHLPDQSCGYGALLLGGEQVYLQDNLTSVKYSCFLFQIAQGNPEVDAPVCQG